MNKRRSSLGTALGAGLLSLCFTEAAAAEEDAIVTRYTINGAPDGSGVVSTTPGDDVVADIFVDPAVGKIVTCGHYTLANGTSQLLVSRFNTNGSADTNFGFLGITTASWSSPTEAAACAITTSGKIVVAARANTATETGFLLVRFTISGALDTTFGIAGYSYKGFSSTQGGPTDIAIASDGKIVVSGSIEPNLPNNDFVVLRYSANGVLDNSFGSSSQKDGVVKTHVSQLDYPGGLVVESNGKIVIAGMSGASPNTSQMTALRYNTGGSLDSTFGEAGKLTIGNWPLYTGSIGQAVVIDASNRFVFAGFAFTNTSIAMAVARTSSTGALDSTFGVGGKRTTTWSGGARASDVKIATDGKLVVSGFVQVGSLYQVALARYSDTGSLDTTFGSGGKVSTSHSPANARAVRLALDITNRPIIGGYRF